MKYKVVEYFQDIADNKREYFPGDIYPREGKTVSAQRLRELSTKANRRGRPMIKKVTTKE